MGGSANKERGGVRRHRQHFRGHDPRPVRVWTPDVRSPAFLAEARRQSELVARSPHAADDMAFAEALSAEIWEPWED